MSIWSGCTRRLGIAPFDANDARPRLVSIEAFAEAYGHDPAEAERQWDAARHADRWDEAAFPIVSQYLDLVAPALDEAAEVINTRDHYFAPLILRDGDHSAYSALHPHLSAHRELAKAMILRGKRDLDRGQLDRAVETYVTLRRLARLQRRQPDLFALLCAISIDVLAADHLALILDDSHLTPANARRILGGLSSLPPALPFHPVTRVGERIFLLQTVQASSRGAPAIAGSQNFGTYEEPATTELPLLERQMDAVLADPRFDLDRAMRRINARYDEMPGGMNGENYTTLAAKSKAYEEETDARGLQAIMFFVLLKDEPAERIMDRLLASQSAEKVADIVADLLLGLTQPGLLAADRTYLQNDVLGEASRVAVALRLHQMDHGRYPDTLAALVSQWLDAVPKDAFADGPLRYATVQGQPVVYSVGPDGEDDGGKVTQRSEDDTGLRLGGDPPGGW